MIEPSDLEKAIQTFSPKLQRKQMLAAERQAIVAELLMQFREHLPADATRIEIDIEWDGGGRCKMESRA